MKFLAYLLLFFFTLAEGASAYHRTVESVAYGKEAEGRVQVQITLSDGSEWLHDCASDEVDHLQGIEDKEVLVRNAGCVFCRFKKELILIVENGNGITKDFKVTMPQKVKENLPQIIAIKEIELEPAGWFWGDAVMGFLLDLSDGSSWVLSNPKIYHYFISLGELEKNGVYLNLPVSDSQFRENVSSWEVGDYLLISTYKDGYYLSIVPAKEKIATEALFKQNQLF